MLCDALTLADCEVLACSDCLTDWDWLKDTDRDT